MNSFQANLILLITALIWGFGFVAQRMGMDHMGPYAFNVCRFLVGATCPKDYLHSVWVFIAFYLPDPVKLHSGTPLLAKALSNPCQKDRSSGLHLQCFCLD